MNTISIIGATISGNRGAEAMLSTVIHKLRSQDPDCNINIFTYYPKRDLKLLKREDVTIYSATPISLLLVLLPSAIIYLLAKVIKLHQLMLGLLPASLSGLAKSSVLIDIAGVSYMDGREIFLPYNILTNLPAFLVGVPVVKFAQGVGPFRNTLNRLAARLFLSRCRLICARGDASYRYLEALFHHKLKYRKCMDVAFLHEVGYSLSHENEGYLSNILNTITTLKASGKDVVGICPNALLVGKLKGQGSDYINEIAKVVIRLLHAGYGVVLFPNATREEAMNKFRNNDLAVIKAIMEKLNMTVTSSLISVLKDVNSDAIKRIIGFSDVLLVSRFHAMIAGLSLAKPLLVVGWSHKYLEVMHEFGLEHYCIDYTSLHENICDRVKEMLRDKLLIENTIMNQLPRVKEQAEWQIDYVFENYM